MNMKSVKLTTVIVASSLAFACGDTFVVLPVATATDTGTGTGDVVGSTADVDAAVDEVKLDVGADVDGSTTGADVGSTRPVDPTYSWAWVGYVDGVELQVGTCSNPNELFIACDASSLGDDVHVADVDGMQVELKPPPNFMQGDHATVEGDVLRLTGWNGCGYDATVVVSVAVWTCIRE